MVMGILGLLVQLFVLVMLAALAVALGNLVIKTLKPILPESRMGQVAVFVLVIGLVMWAM